MRIGLTSVDVDDQEQPLRCSTDVLGLRLQDDAPYDADRPHRSWELAPPLPGASPLRAASGPPVQVVARPVLGGLHHVYRRAA
jgi:hypothetical protein